MHEPTIATDELRPTYLEVDLDVLAANYRAIAAHVAPARVMPILKANAYGHGLVEVARKLEAIGAPYVGVAYLEEGMRLRAARRAAARAGHGRHRRLADPALPRARPHAHRVVGRQAARDRRARGRARPSARRVHLKIDTGMERIGVHWYSAETLLEASLKCRHAARRGDLHALRERRRARPHARAPAARALPRSAALLRAPLAAGAAAPRRELRRDPAAAREPLRPRASRRPASTARRRRRTCR